LPNFWLTSRPWLMLAFIGAFIFCQLLVFKHGFPESRKLFKTPIFERWGKQICLNE
jgi:type II secretory pathway component PulF